MRRRRCPRSGAHRRTHTVLRVPLAGRLPTAEACGMDPVAVLARLGGAARREALLGRGVSVDDLYGALSRGVITRPFRGCYVLPGTSRAQVMAALYRCEVSCITLIRRSNLPLLRDTDAVHLALPRDRARRATDKRPRDGVRFHREDREPWRSPLAHALKLAARCLPRDEWLVPADALVHRRLLSVDDVVAAGSDGGIGSTWIRRVIDPACGSPAETVVRVPLMEAGLAVASQVDIATIGRVDLVVERRVIIEVDGRSYHSDPAAFAEDRRRDRAAARLGLTVLRYPASEVLQAPDKVLADVREILQFSAPPASSATRNRRNGLT